MCWKQLNSEVAVRFHRRPGRLTFVIAATLFALVGSSFSQSSGNSKTNNAVCVGPGDKWSTAITSDGAGGAILAWQDNRSGNYDIFAQKIDLTGKVKWTDEGIAVCPDAQRQGYPKLVGDGSGGAIIAWCDDRSGNCDIFAQKVSASGVIEWAKGGVPVCKALGGRTAPAIVADGSGGAIIAWHENRTGSFDIYAQRMDASGKMKWSSAGVSICTYPADQLYPVLVSDGSGGAIIAWDDIRNANHDIYAQKVSSSGDIEWIQNGVPVCTANENQMNPALISDGSGGAIIVWHDKRGGDYDIYAQRLNSDGKPSWTRDGLQVCTAKGDQSSPSVTTDGAGGAIVSWCDRRGGECDIYAQRISGSGKIQWAIDGVEVCVETGNQMYPAVVNDGIGGAIIAWHDGREAGLDIYAARVDASGATKWKKGGVDVCKAEGDQASPVLVQDGSGGAIITWNDPRSAHGNVYAQRVDRDGNLVMAR